MFKYGIPTKILELNTGVENVKADSRSKTVVVKSRTADPAKVCERVQKKTKRRVELISPLPPPPEEEKKEETPPPPPEEKKEEVFAIALEPCHSSFVKCASLNQGTCQLNMTTEQEQDTIL